MKRNYAKIAGILEILIGVIVLMAIGPTAILSLASPGGIEFFGLNFAWLLGSISLLGFGFLINGIVMILSGENE